MWQKSVRYLDYNAGAGFHNSVQDKLIELLNQKEFFAANPSSRHRLGQKMQHHLYKSAQSVANSLGRGVTPDSIHFVASGTDANQTVIRSILSGGLNPVQDNRVGAIIGSGEHSASFDLIESLVKHGTWVRQLCLHQNGQYDFSQLEKLISDAELAGLSKILLSLFWVNNETGVITDLVALRKLLNELRMKHPKVAILLHLDGAQAWGKIEIEAFQTPADWITFSSHKIGAPAGTGVIWSRHPSIPKRAGTENWMGIVTTGFAAEMVDPHTFSAYTKTVRDHFESRLNASGIPIKIWGLESNRVSNTTRFSFLSFQAYENWVELLDLNGFAVSHGSACKSRVIEPSRVLLEMGASREDALNSIRVSLGQKNSIEDVDLLVDTLIEVYEKKKKPQPQEQT